MDGENTFREISEQDIPSLEQDLQSDVPNSIHALSFLKVIQKWKKADRSLEAKIMAVNGDYRTRMILLYTLTSNGDQFRGTALKWSHSDDDNEKIIEALKRTKSVLPWFAKFVFLTDLTPETVTVLKPAMDEIWESKKWRVFYEEFLYWVPMEEAAAWTIDLPTGTELSFLNETHVKDVLEHWRYNFDGAEELVRSVVRNNFGLGLFDSSTGELMSWAAQMFYGGIGLLQTKEHHKKKGYGKIVLRATSKEIAQRGFDVHMVILESNDASKALAGKCNFRRVNNAIWIDKVDVVDKKCRVS